MTNTSDYTHTSMPVTKEQKAYQFLENLGYRWNGREWVRTAGFWGAKGDIA